MRWGELRALAQVRRDERARVHAYGLAIGVYALLQGRHAAKAHRADEQLEEALQARLALQGEELGKLRALVDDLGRSFLAGHTVSGVHRGDHDAFPMGHAPVLAPAAFVPDRSGEARCTHCPVAAGAECRLLCTEVPTGPWPPSTADVDVNGTGGVRQ